MKKEKTLRSLLGITQDDLALLLKVDRTVLAKYEAGSRDLPLEAKLQLNEMVQYMCAPETMQKLFDRPEQKAQKQRALERMLTENEFQQMAITRKVERVEVKCTGQLRLLQLIDFLFTKDSAKEYSLAAILRSIAHKAHQRLKSQGMEKLFKLKLQLEMLQLEKLLLQAEILKMDAKPNENKE